MQSKLNTEGIEKEQVMVGNEKDEKSVSGKSQWRKRKRSCGNGKTSSLEVPETGIENGMF